MGALITVLILITCVILVIVVLIQNPKGGGLSAEFSSSNQYMGVRKTADFFEKTTWTLAMALLSLRLLSNIAKPREAEIGESVMQEQIDNAPLPVAPPAAPNPIIPQGTE